MNKETMEIKLVSGVEGPSLYLNDYRIAGPKPWGGGYIVNRFHVTVDDLQSQIDKLEGGKK